MFYFDSEQLFADTDGPLCQIARSAVSRRNIDYSDYRDVSGVKFPFKFKVTWLDGLENVTLTDVQVNVPGLGGEVRGARPAAARFMAPRLERIAKTDVVQAFRPARRGGP